MRGFVYDVARTGLLIFTLLVAIWCLLFIDSGLQSLSVRSVGIPPSYRDWERKFTRVPKIRVRLSEPTGTSSVTIRSRYQIDLVRGGANADRWKRIREDRSVQVTRNNQKLLLNGTPVGAGPIRFRTTEEGEVVINGKRYRGSAVIRLLRNGGLEVINRVSINRYLRGVIQGELPRDAPIEALRAQAIAARSYVIWERTHQRTKNPAAKYDVKDTTQSQVYRGRSGEWSRARQAVKSTRGVILLYQSNLLHAYYHSTCGGRTAHAAYALAHEEPPIPSPLQGGVECKWDSDSQFYRWDATFTGSALTNRIKSLPKSVIRRLRVTKRTPNKRARTVTASFSGDKQVRMEARTVRRALRGTGARSNWFYFEKQGENQFRIRGRGWGHGVGMCQMGAIGLAEEGATYDDILTVYYPGVTLADAYN